MKCASFDGDADRLVYFFQGEDSKLRIIDGDKQFALIMMYIRGLLKSMDLTEEQVSHVLVMTNYCNS